MSISHTDIARILSTLDREASGGPHSIRFTAAAIAMHGLLSSGVAERQTAAMVAKVAYGCAEAFLEETVRRLLPGAEGI